MYVLFPVRADLLYVDLLWVRLPQNRPGTYLSSIGMLQSHAMVHAMEMEGWVWVEYVEIELVLSLVLLHIDTSTQPLL